jgi:single-strand DNA-binding protein
MINRVTLVGNLGRDPEIRRLENGTPVARITMATNENYKDQTSGEWVTQTEWHDVIAWRLLAEQAERQLKKGSMVYVEGKLTHRKYTDKNGIERYATEVVALMIRSLDRKEGGGLRESSFPTQEPAMTQRQTSQMNQTADPEFEVVAPVGEPPEPADDLPF